MSGARLRRRNGEHPAAHFKHQIRAPLDLLGGARQREAALPQPLEVHARIVIGRPRATCSRIAEIVRISPDYCFSSAVGP